MLTFTGASNTTSDGLYGSENGVIMGKPPKRNLPCDLTGRPELAYDEIAQPIGPVVTRCRFKARPSAGF
jgi:hypothetical protein